MNQTLLTKSRTWWWIVPLLLLVTWLGARSLNADTIWYDEYWSLYYAGSMPHYGPGSLSDTWNRVATTFHELNPPGYYLLLHVWGQVAGWTPFVGRALSLFIGLLSITWIYRLGRDISTPLGGIAAAIALGLSAFFINFTHELRAYLLFPFLITLSLWAYWRLVYGPQPRLSIQLLFVLSLTALLYTHYMAIPVIIATALYHLIFAPKNRNWLRVSLLAVLAGIFFLPWATTALGALEQVNNDPSRDFYALPILPLLWQTLTSFSNGSNALLAVFVWYAFRDTRHTVRFIGFILLATLLTALGINAVVQFITDARYLLALWPLLALVVGLGVAFMARNQLRPMLLILIWSFIGVFTTLAPGGETQSTDEWQVRLEWNVLAELLQPLAAPGDDVIYYLPQPVPHWIIAPVAAYYLYELPALIEPFPFLAEPPNLLTDHDPIQVHLVESLVDKPPSDYEEEAADLLRDESHIWIAYNPTYLPSPFTQPVFDRALADTGFELCDPLYAQPDLFLGLYARTIDLEPAYQFSENITLSLVNPLPNRTSDHLALLLNWQLAEDVPLNTYSMSLQVLDAEGNFLINTDFGLPGRQTACQRVTVPVDTLPPGTYQLALVVYNWQTGERLTSGTAGEITDTDTLPLGEFVIE